MKRPPECPSVSIGATPRSTCVVGPPMVPTGGEPAGTATNGLPVVARGTGSGLFLDHHSRYSALTQMELSDDGSAAGCACARQVLVSRTASAAKNPFFMTPPYTAPAWPWRPGGGKPLPTW